MSLEWDRSITVGDLVTGYHKGIWKVTKIDRRFLTQDDLRYQAYKDREVGEEYSSLVHYQQVLTEDYQKGRKVSKNCDISYCRKIDDAFIKEKREELERQIGILENLRKTEKI